MGAGAEKTILYRDPTTHYSQPSLQLRDTGNDACVTQITGISLLCVRNTDDTGQDYGIIIDNIRDFRIEHSYFEDLGFAAVRAEGDSSGVIDHSISWIDSNRGMITWVMVWWFMEKVAGIER